MIQGKNIFDFLHFSNPTIEQQSVLKKMENFVAPMNEEDFLILSGAAGTGKTSITSALVGFLNEQKSAFKICAPTGRAARIIGRKAESTANTIHSLIYNVSTNNKTGCVNWTLKDWCCITPVVFIIDEASMIAKNQDVENTLFSANAGLLFDLITYIKKGNRKNKIVFIGDEYQLEPIHEKESFALNATFLSNTFNLKGSVSKLTEVKRQDDGSYILENATSIREAIDAKKTSCSIHSIRENKIYGAAKSYAKRIEKDGYESSIAISCTHKSNALFNSLVRQERFGYVKMPIEKRDILLVTQNWNRNESRLYNGDQVEVLEVDWQGQEKVCGLTFVPIKLRPLFSNEVIEDLFLLDTFKEANGKISSEQENVLRQARYVKNQIYRESNQPADDKYVGAIRLMFGYAITCNKAQGGEWQNVYVNTIKIPSLKWQYTAVTRAEKELHTF